MLGVLLVLDGSVQQVLNRWVFLDDRHRHHVAQEPPAVLQVQVSVFIEPIPGLFKVRCLYAGLLLHVQHNLPHVEDLFVGQDGVALCDEVHLLSVLLDGRLRSRVLALYTETFEHGLHVVSIQPCEVLSHLKGQIDKDWISSFLFPSL